MWGSGGVSRVGGVVWVRAKINLCLHVSPLLLLLLFFLFNPPPPKNKCERARGDVFCFLFNWGLRRSHTSPHLGVWREGRRGRGGLGRGAGGQLRSCINHVSSGLTLLSRLSLPSGEALAPPAFGTVSHFERLIDGAQHQGRFARLLFLQLCRVASMTELSLQFFLLSLCISVLFIPQFLISSLPSTPHIPLMRDTHADRPPRKKMTLDDTILASSSRTIGCLQIRVYGHY